MNDLNRRKRSVWLTIHVVEVPAMALRCENCELVVENRQLSSAIHEVAPTHCPQCDEYVIWIDHGPEVTEPRTPANSPSIVRRVRNFLAS